MQHNREVVLLSWRQAFFSVPVLLLSKIPVAHKPVNADTGSLTENPSDPPGWWVILNGTLGDQWRGDVWALCTSIASTHSCLPVRTIFHKDRPLFVFQENGGPAGHRGALFCRAAVRQPADADLWPCRVTDLFHITPFWAIHEWLLGFHCQILVCSVAAV